MTNKENTFTINVSASEGLQNLCGIIFDIAYGNGPEEVKPADLFSTLIDCHEASIIEVYDDEIKNLAETLTGVNLEMLQGAERIMAVLFISPDTEMSDVAFGAFHQSLESVAMDHRLRSGILYDEDMEGDGFRILFIINKA